MLCDIYRLLIVVLSVCVSMPLAAQIQLPEHDAIFQHNYARYDRPAQCLEAVGRETRHAQRSHVRDTMEIDIDTDTLPARVIQEARRCAASFHIDALARDQLFAYSALALAAGWDDSARRAIDRRLVLSRQDHESVQRQGERYVEAIEQALAAVPLRITIVHTLMQELGALGPSAAFALVTAHGMLLDNATKTANVALAAEEATTILRLTDLLPTGDRAMHYREIFEAVKTRLRIALVHGDTALAAQGVRDFHEKYVTLPTLPGVPDSVLAVLRPLMNRASEAEPALRGIMSAVTETGLPPAPAIHAQHWYGPTGSPTTPPMSGVRIIKINPNVNGLREFAEERRLMKEFGPKGVTLIVVTQTHGQFRGHVYESPEQEAERLRVFLQDTARVPGVLAIYETQFTKLWDGRYREQQNPNRAVGNILIDAQNRCYTLLQIGILPNDAWLHELLERLIDHPQPAKSQTSAVPVS